MSECLCKSLCVRSNIVCACVRMFLTDKNESNHYPRHTLDKNESPFYARLLALYSTHLSLPLSESSVVLVSTYRKYLLLDIKIDILLACANKDKRTRKESLCTRNMCWNFHPFFFHYHHQHYYYSSAYYYYHHNFLFHFICIATHIFFLLLSGRTCDHLVFCRNFCCLRNGMRVRNLCPLRIIVSCSFAIILLDV